MCKPSVGILILIIYTLALPNGSLAKDLSKTDKAILTTVVKYHHNVNKDCDAHRNDIEAKTLIKLGKKLSVVLVQCQIHAYQVSWVAYTAEGEASDLFISQISFPDTVNGQMFTATNRLINPNWNNKTRTLHTFAKGRGVGDCGSIVTYGWNGSAFFLLEARHQVCCWFKEDFNRVESCKKIKDEYPIPVEKWPLVYKYQGKKN